MYQPRSWSPERAGSAFSRRGFLGAAAAIGAAAGLSACTGGGQSSEQAGGAAGGATGSIAWWDQYRPLTKLFEDGIFAGYMKDHQGVKITRREMEGPDLGQALQLAKRSNQLPDVTSTAGLDAAAAALVDEQWFQPIGDLVDVEGSPVGDYLYDGVHRFDGKLYSFPVFTGRVHACIPWSNTAQLKKAGVDPDESPATWDDFRAVARTCTKKTADDVYGVLLPGKDPTYFDSVVGALAQTAGAPGGIDWRTGNYVYDSQQYGDAIEYLLSLQADKVVHPSSPSMGPRDARARWAAGQGVIYPWGSWIIGGLMVEEPQSIERGIGVWHIPTQETTRHFIHGSPSGGTFWVTSSSKHAKLAADVMLQLSSVDVQKKLAATMDAPPVLLDLVSESEAHPTYKKSVEYLQSDVRIGPDPTVGTPGVAAVLATMRDIHPNVGEITQAAMTGSERNYRAKLRTFNQKMTAERERAIKQVQKSGTDVSEDAWVFGNWDPTRDYTPDSYQSK